MYRRATAILAPMKRLLAVLGASLLAATSAAQTPVHFTATVQWPNRFEHEIRPGLIFTMEPLDGEWRFAVKPSATSEENYAECITGPLHGPTDLDLLPWQWAPTAPKGYDQHVPGVQKFSFVLDEDSQRYECAAAKKVAEDIGEGKDTENGAPIGPPHYKARPRGDVRVTVLGFHLQQDPNSHDVLFRDVKVTVDITLPATKEKRPR